MIPLTTCTVKLLALQFAILALCLLGKSRLMFTVHKISPYVYCSQISPYVFFLKYRFIFCLLVFITRLSIYLSRPWTYYCMYLSNWTITLYFSTIEFKLDTLLSGLACHTSAFPFVMPGLCLILKSISKLWINNALLIFGCQFNTKKWC